MAERQIKRALISVYDKTGIVDFARALVNEFGIGIISTGGTASLLKENGIPVTLVETITGFPEMLDGRVKTLHPKIYAAILADRDNPEHMRQLAEQGIEPIDMVVVNLYPFEKTVADPNCTFEQAIEMIDIGGPCLLRAAAKNHRHVIPIVRREGLEYVLEELRENRDLLETGRAVLASVVYEETSDYDRTVDEYLSNRWTELRCGPGPSITPTELVPVMDWMQHLRLWKARECGYGENPHQRAALYKQSGSDVILKPVPSASLSLSYNNYNDADAALGLCRELTRALAGTEGRAKILFARQPETPPGPTATRFAPVDDEILTRRKLPHWQIPGATYYVTFRSAIGVLTTEERDIVMSSIRHWSGVRLDLHAAAVMPDHVHMLLTPRDVGETTDRQHNLSALLQSIKAHSGREIARRRGGDVRQVWVRESFDRWVRSESDFIEKYTYMANNPVKEGLADSPEAYRWWYGVEALPGDPCFEESARQAGGAGEDKDPLCPPSTAGKENLCPPSTAGKENLCPPGTAGKENLCPPLTCVFIKHTNACGVGVHADPIESYRRAYIGDPNAAMGGVLACNFDVTPTFAEAVMETYDRWGKSLGAGGFFAEVWVAPEFNVEAVTLIRNHKKSWGGKVRLLVVGDMSVAPTADELDYRKIAGGMLVQTADNIGLHEDQWKVVTKRAPSDCELSDLRLGWLIAKHTKSNAISICKDGMLIGNGAGQMSRVMSCRIATWLAKENRHDDMLKGSVAASDAFFPFPDGPNILMDAGVTAIIQPGGSKNDDKVIAACDERGVAMIFTGTRHFRH